MKEASPPLNLLLDSSPGGAGTAAGVGNLVAFVRTAESGSFARAAVALGRTPSGIAKAVGRLEERLGITLFARTTRALSLTHCGELVLEQAKNVLGALSDAESAITTLRGGLHGRLRVSVPPGLGDAVVLPSLPSFTASYPEINLEMTFDDRPIDVVGGGYDIALRSGPLADSALMTKRIGRSGSLLCAAPSYLTRRGTPQSISDLSKHDCIRHRTSTNGRIEPWGFSAAPSDAAPALLPTTHLFNDLRAVLFAVQAGMGVGLLPQPMVASLVAERRLTVVLEGARADEPKDDIWLVWPPDRRHVPKVRAFADHVTKLFVER
ncbi:LysR substrate-binding domain-containing protein [Pendulispora albinea]|uniref:LysR substrate-binding domain-containing protein n=1 Tax=Pendulispora albinea TaxID=2741071 RepID=A0ABZ2M5R2_9BACT